MAHICFPELSVPSSGQLYLQSCSRLELTALKSNKYSGWTTIIHPFHPLRGTRLKILTFKTFNKRDILSLQLPTQNQNEAGIGVMAIPRDWTDKADPNPYQDITNFAPILSYFHLHQLTELVDTLSQIKPNLGIDT